MNWFVDNHKWLEADAQASKGEPWRKYYKGPRVRPVAVIKTSMRH
jgi:L-2-aminoadipate reductase